MAKNKVGSSIGSTIGAVCIIIILIGLVSSCFDDDTSSPSSSNSNWSEEKSIECRNRSDTYYKCSWNVWEDRCTCKQR